MVTPGATDLGFFQVATLIFFFVTRNNAATPVRACEGDSCSRLLTDGLARSLNNGWNCLLTAGIAKGRLNSLTDGNTHLLTDLLTYFTSIVYENHQF